MILTGQSPPDSDPQRHVSNLPAPYVSPWQEFSRNLRNLIADLRLRSIELWRRNGEGDLLVPGFWPQQLTSLFWPLVLLLVVGLPLLGLQLGTREVVAPPQPVSFASATVEPVPVPAPEAVPEGPMSTPVSDATPNTHATPDSHVDPPPEPASPLLPELDPLLQLFLDGSAPDGLLLSASPRLSEDSLVLMLSDQWFDLPAQRRETLAQSWFERAAALGDACLQLVDGHDQLLARCARVGSGMILFDREPVA